MLDALFGWWFGLSRDDPVRHCQFHREMGCCHVDGPGCDMKTCPILADYREFCGDD